MFLDSYARGAVTVQFIRVLQQIAIAYTLAFFFLYCPWTVQLGGALAILAVHTLAYQWGGSGLDPWVPRENFGARLDRWLHHTASAVLNLILPSETGDHPNILPLSTGNYVTFNAFSSTSTILMGVLAGRLLRADRPASFKLVVMIGTGLLCLAAGWFLQPAVPMVKRLWTASFTLFAAGWTWLLLAAFYAVIDVAGWKGWAFPFVVVGLNSIFIYVSAGVLDSNIRKAVNLVLPPYLLVPEWRPVVLATLTVSGHWLLCLWLYRHKIFFKV
jgi:predicted acyltransferase